MKKLPNGDVSFTPGECGMIVSVMAFAGAVGSSPQDEKRILALRDKLLIGPKELMTMCCAILRYSLPDALGKLGEKLPAGEIDRINANLDMLEVLSNAMGTSC